MTAGKFQQSLEALANRTPSRAFTVELIGGRRFEVDDARAMVIRDGVAVFLALGGVPFWFNHESVTAVVADTPDAA